MATAAEDRLSIERYPAHVICGKPAIAEQSRFMSTRPKKKCSRKTRTISTTNTGATTGPASVVHSVNLSEYGIWQGPLKDDDRAKLLINMHDYFFPTKADRKRAIKEIINKRYFADKRAYVATPRRVFKHLRKEHADSLCERGELGLGPLNYYTTVENENNAA